MTAGSFAYYYTKLKGELGELSTQQADDFSRAVKIYEEIIDLNKGSGLETQGTSVLGIQSTQETGAVLGLEDSPFVKQARKEKALLTEAQDVLNNIETRNSRVENTANRIKYKELPTTKTRDYLATTQPVLNYLREMQQLKIEFFTTGVQLGLMINDAIARNADEVSVKKYSEGLGAFESLKKRAEAIDTKGLDQRMIDEHKDFTDTIMEETAVFYEVETALKEKDLQKLITALRSMTLEGASDIESGTTTYVSFWEDGNTLKGARELEKSWNEVSTRIK